MKVRATKRAQAQIARAANWWHENRPLAPEAFDEELTEAFTLLTLQPAVGAPVSNTRATGMRRLHLARIHYFLYYPEHGEEVQVLAVWHTSRARGPNL